MPLGDRPTGVSATRHRNPWVSATPGSRKLSRRVTFLARADHLVGAGRRAGLGTTFATVIVAVSEPVAAVVVGHREGCGVDAVVVGHEAEGRTRALGDHPAPAVGHPPVEGVGVYRARVGKGIRSAQRRPPHRPFDRPPRRPPAHVDDPRPDACFRRAAQVDVAGEGGYGCVRSGGTARRSRRSAGAA